MKFPAYWSRGTAEDVDRNGKPVCVTCWRWSDVSQDDARQTAQAAAKRILASRLAGRPLARYGYGEAPLREEVLQTFRDDAGQLVAAITLNAYGSLVLNAARVMFIDIDFPPVGPGEGMWHFFARLFGRESQSPDDRRQREAEADLARFVDSRPTWGLRAYRTCAGMRILVTHDLFDPAGDEALAAFTALAADPLYVRLCKAQQSFRARLTPKPWRCGHTANVIRWPHESPQAQQAFEKWQATYAACQSSYATCRFLATLGSGHVHPDAERVIDIHDNVTRAGESLALA